MFLFIKAFWKRDFKGHYDFSKKQSRAKVFSHVSRLKISLSLTISRQQLPRFPVWMQCGNQYCDFCFFHKIWGFSVLSGVLGFLLRIWVFLTLVKFYKCMLYYCIFHSRMAVPILPLGWLQQKAW